jgi:hypothetical protein
MPASVGLLERNNALHPAGYVLGHVPITAGEDAVNLDVEFPDVVLVLPP